MWGVPKRTWDQVCQQGGTCQTPGYAPWIHHRRLPCLRSTFKIQSFTASTAALGPWVALHAAGQWCCKQSFWCSTHECMAQTFSGFRSVAKVRGDKKQHIGKRAHRSAGLAAGLQAVSVVPLLCKYLSP